MLDKLQHSKYYDSMNTKNPLSLQLNMIDNIDRQLKRMKITRQELADRTGFQYSTISRLMNCHHSPTLNTCVRIAAELGIDPVQLFIRNGKYATKTTKRT